ncbi:MAG: hypothetical protein IJD01_00175 [Clostridia bacterium]|nr:hypothetical protein [Clostridia bacterium]
MTPNQFHEALSQLDDDLLEEVDAQRLRRRTPAAVWRILAAAACLCLLAGVAVLLLTAPPTAAPPPPSSPTAPPLDEWGNNESLFERVRILSWKENGFFAVIPDPTYLQIQENAIVFVTFSESEPPYVCNLIADGAWCNEITGELLEDPDAAIGELGETRIIDGVSYIWAEDIRSLEQRLPTPEDLPVGSTADIEIEYIDDSGIVPTVYSTMIYNFVE